MDLSMNGVQALRKRVITNEGVLNNFSQNSINVNKDGDSVINNRNNDCNESLNTIQVSASTKGDGKSIIDNSHNKCNRSVNIISD